MDYDNKWYLRTCREAGLKDDNYFSKISLQSALNCGFEMRQLKVAIEVLMQNNLKKEAQEHQAIYDDINQQRIAHMLNALEWAEKLKDDIELQAADDFIRQGSPNAHALMGRNKRKSGDMTFTMEAIEEDYGTLGAWLLERKEAEGQQ